MSSISGLDTWSVISGAIGVLTILPLICAYVWTQHPEAKFAQLESTLKETEDLLRSVVEEGLLDPERHVAHFELHLKKFRRKTEQFRDETYMASNEWRKLLGAWYNGLSKRISLLCEKVKTVRANICETSANARMQQMQLSCDEVAPPHHTYVANFFRFCKRIVSFVYPKAQTADAPTSTTTLTSEGVSCPLGDATTTSVSEIPCARSLSQSPESREVSSQHPTLDSVRSSHRVSRPASKARDHHVLVRALRHVDRRLASQGVTNALLAQLVQATHKQWSPASGRARPSRRSHKQRRPMPHPEHVMPLQRASEPGIDSDADSSGEETMCEV